MPKIFVYGTLKSNKSRNFYLTRDDAKLVGPAKTTPDYRLVQRWFADYPCLIEEKDGMAVEGELWQVNDKTLEVLDSIEGVKSGLFKRAMIKLSDGSEALGYVCVNRPYPYWSVNNGNWQ